MSKKTENIIESIATVLSSEKAYRIPAVCNKYNLGNGEDYSSPGSKYKYIESLLFEKNADYIINLAKQIIEDYRSDFVGKALNHYFDGKYYKLSELTRKDLLSELYEIGNINGKLSIDEFLEKCELKYIKPTENILFNYILGNKSDETEKQINLNELLRNSNIHESLDEKFFQFLEQIVHPYVRTNEDSKQYVSLINGHLKKDNLQLHPASEISGEPVYKIHKNSGIQDSVKNLIFAANGYKPEIVLDDALSNRIKIVKNSDYCLVYDKPIKNTGLLWVDLVEWWAELNKKERNKDTAKELNERLLNSLDSKPEQILFKTYYKIYSQELNRKLPALIPQVYLHYDPYSIKKYGIQYLLRQRMDFLFVLSNSTRIVIEVDGKQHYSDDNTSSPKKYAEMVSLDRDLKLLGYEVYRFGGYELTESNERIIIDFFDKLFKKHGIIK
ncbi:MAG: hypothetical protein GZ091_14500 [Paludibacter sp.]|nr:hypothetical protein [Paludibacter sp.]